MLGGCARNCWAAAAGQLRACSRACATNAAGSSRRQQQRRLRLFEEELQRQRSRRRAAGSITVSFVGADGQPASAELPAGQATPLDVAARVSEEAARSSALALVDEAAWDMHRPLAASCSLRLLQFRRPASAEEAADLHACNLALFRSGSLLLGAVLETAFKEAYRVKLVSFPPPVPKSGSFVYDCQVTKPQQEHSILRLSDCVSWRPSRAELRVLSSAGHSLVSAGHTFQPLEVPAPLAEEMFRHNDVKLAAARKILETRRKDTLSVYRVGSFVDISGGPMIANTSLIGRFLVASVHQLESKELGPLLRVQGLAVPRALAAELGPVQELLQHAESLNYSFLPAGQAAAAQSPAAAASSA